MTHDVAMVDGNEAAAWVAYQASEVIAIYPITPSSPMGELADAWAAAGKRNLAGVVPRVIEMQSEGGAAGALHGAITSGALTTTFTASQGLLLMIPNMYKIAGELSPTVFHVAARTLATHALSIFGDHSDVMAARQTGWAMLCSGSPQECQDLAAIAHVATLASRIPFVHFFDGFRTSHEINKVVRLDPNDLNALFDQVAINEHRRRGLSPDRPSLRGTAQNPDVFFQAREASNPFHAATPAIVADAMDRFAHLTGRRYRLFDYEGAPDAERVMVLMGSGYGAAREGAEYLLARGEKVGLLRVRLYRPFSIDDFINALPPTTRALAVMDRTKEPGAIGEPLYQDVVAAIAEGWPTRASSPTVIGGRYGLSSKEFTPAMAIAVFHEAATVDPKRHFTVGIVDDVTRLSLTYDNSLAPEPPEVFRAVFYGLGSDGTVGANKNSVKIIGENTALHAQGYFVYDSKKAGSVTVSHLRFSPKPIHSTYLIERANFVACHQFQFLDRWDALELAEPGATFLLNAPFPASEVWDHLPVEAQRSIIEKRLRVFVVDALSIARDAGLGSRINTVMQTCFFALAGIIPRDEAIAHIKKAIDKTYAKRGESVLRSNHQAVDAALAGLRELEPPRVATSNRRMIQAVAATESDFARRVTAVLIAGKGNHLPVSALPPDGTFPTGTARMEKRSIASEIPIWDPAVCIECGLCALVCPHAAIRGKVYQPECLAHAPATFSSKPWSAKDIPEHVMTIQVAPDDCTGCGVCVDVCPAHRKDVIKHKAINMRPKEEHVVAERANFEHFAAIPELPRDRARHETVKGSQLLEPLFEFSGACAGCGETPYLKLLTQLFGDRIVIANATGCSSIYGGNLPTTPWTVNADGRGPAWSNSLFEDNAEFGLGMRLAIDAQRRLAEAAIDDCRGVVEDSLLDELLGADQSSEDLIAAQRRRVATLKERLKGVRHPSAPRLLALADHLVRRGVWIIGGDGWAYDIGFGGLDHVLATGQDVNILVLDTEVYSNTGGQASKSTPRAAVAKFASGGKSVGKKDLGMIAMAYGDVYVAQIAMGASPQQTVKAFLEAESYPGPSLIIAYSHCIAHGIDMSTAMTHQKDATASGYWPLYRFDPRGPDAGRKGAPAGHPFQLDSKRPTIPLRDFTAKEARFAMLERSDPETARRLLQAAQHDVNARWKLYEQLAGVDRSTDDDPSFSAAGGESS